MELELFKKTYTSTMMRLVKKLAEKLESEIKQDLMCENHHVILKAKHKMDDLAEAKMLLSIYDPPKETPEQTNPIDPFEGAPEWARFRVASEDEKEFYCENRPQIHSTPHTEYWIFPDGKFIQCPDTILYYHDWKESLIEKK